MTPLGTSVSPSGKGHDSIYLVEIKDINAENALSISLFFSTYWVVQMSISSFIHVRLLSTPSPQSWAQ